MKKENIISTGEKICPFCGRKVGADIQLVTPQKKKAIAKLESLWFIIENVDYLNDNEVHFRNPPPPIEPRQHHDAACFDDNGYKKTKWYHVKFTRSPEDDPEPAVGHGGHLTEDGIRTLTEAKVVSGEWHWRAIVCPTPPDPGQPPHAPRD